jgi:hypothetical protein
MCQLCIILSRTVLLENTVRAHAERAAGALVNVIAELVVAFFFCCSVSVYSQPAV